MDRVETKILVAVAAKSGENPDRRKGQGSSAMFVSRGSVGPKTYPNRSTPNGKQVNIPVPFNNKLTLPDMSGVHAWTFKRASLRRAVMARNRRKRDDVSWQIPGVREKGVESPYRDPTLVPQAEKAKACRHMLAKGIRQNSHVTSG